ncbi:hypothetical protein EDC04DRAFT_377776 [Pisolithus marmoratus]|nr:hypothetical protein EDC04DRAFT_377776 [Pisolithus marmoratus]
MDWFHRCVLESFVHLLWLFGSDTAGTLLWDSERMCIHSLGWFGPQVAASLLTISIQTNYLLIMAPLSNCVCNGKLDNHASAWRNLGTLSAVRRTCRRRTPGTTVVHHVVEVSRGIGHLNNPFENLRCGTKNLLVELH